MNYLVVDWWKENNVYYAIYYRKDNLFFSESVINEEKDNARKKS